jgi:hypothetical protein
MIAACFVVTHSDVPIVVQVFSRARMATARSLWKRPERSVASPYFGSLI